MSTTATGALHAIIEWAKAEGEVKALDRLRVYCLGVLLKEGIGGLQSVTPTTACSAATLDEVRAAAEKVVGKPCPK